MMVAGQTFHIVRNGFKLTNDLLVNGMSFSSYHVNHDPSQWLSKLNDSFFVRIRTIDSLREEFANRSAFQMMIEPHMIGSARMDVMELCFHESPNDLRFTHMVVFGDSFVYLGETYTINNFSYFFLIFQ